MAGPLNTKAIHDAIAAQILAVTGIAVNSWDTVSPAYPAITILPGSPYLDYHQSFGGLVDMNLLIEVCTNAVEKESAQIALSRFVNAGTGESSSIMDAVEKVTAPDLTPTVGGVVSNIKVKDVSLSNRTNAAGDITEYVATFTVAVMVRRA